MVNREFQSAIRNSQSSIEYSLAHVAFSAVGKYGDDPLAFSKSLSYLLCARCCCCRRPATQNTLRPRQSPKRFADVIIHYHQNFVSEGGVINAGKKLCLANSFNLFWAGGMTTIDRSLGFYTVSYTHLRAHETPEHLVCRLLL